MQVISRARTLLAASRHIGREEPFIRRLVGRETDIAIYAVYAILRLQTFQLLVCDGKKRYKALHIIDKAGSQHIISRFMLMKPIAVVVRTELYQKIKQLTHHISTPFYGRHPLHN